MQYFARRIIFAVALAAVAIDFFALSVWLSNRGSISFVYGGMNEAAGWRVWLSQWDNFSWLASIAGGAAMIAAVRMAYLALKALSSDRP